MLHHHLLPIPGTGRERSTVMDAGDLLEVLMHAGVHVVLSGHKHVPYVWRLEDLYVANAGTVSSMRVRGHTKPCYNVLEFDGDDVRISRLFPFGDRQLMASFSLFETSRLPELEGRLLLVEDYDMRLARRLVSGVDVWLNNPVFPLEASGTSGMKAGINGVINLSVLDGWPITDGWIAECYAEDFRKAMLAAAPAGPRLADYTPEDVK